MSVPPGDDRSAGAATRDPQPALPHGDPAFVGMFDEYGDGHERAPDEHAHQSKQCTWRDLMEPRAGETPGAELLEDIDAYLEPFCAPIFVDGKNLCPHCGHALSGSLISSLLGPGGFEWGLAHGEGRCRCCKWPARLYHFVKDRHGEDLMTFRHLALAYRPADGAPTRQDEPAAKPRGDDLPLPHKAPGIPGREWG